jgi:Ca-activated chloride channel homolog
MQFLWPHNLWWMLLLPVLLLVYLWLLRQRRRQVVVLPSLSVAREALALWLLALARPISPVVLPWGKSTIMLAMDISRSMRVQDVKPNRMVAAQEAAKAFLAEVPRQIEVGLVTFAGTASVAQQATTDRPSLVSAIDAIQMQFGTALGNAIVISVAELFPEDGIDLVEMSFGQRRPARALGEPPAKPQAAAKPLSPVPPGSYDAAAIILLTDGRRTTGVDTLQAAKLAADRGVRIHVVGLGTPDGHASMGDEMAIYLQLDEPTLRKVAEMTGGEYHHAGTAEALRSVYQNLGSSLQLRKRETELTALVSLAAALVLALGVGLSLLWFGRSGEAA